MKFLISGDYDWESGLDNLLNELSGLGYLNYFQERDYGPGLARIVAFLICQNPALNLKRRIRLSKKDKVLYLDIMLDLPTMKCADIQTRKRIVAEMLVKEVSEVTRKYKIVDFDTQRFIDDLKAWVIATGW